MVNCTLLPHRSVSRVLQRHQKCMNRVGSVASLNLAFFIIQYFLIDKGISVTSDIISFHCVLPCLVMMYHQTNLDCKSFSISEDLVETIVALTSNRAK